MHWVSVRLVASADSSAAYETQILTANLPNGSTMQVPVASGQHFPSIPPGNSSFSFQQLVDSVKNWEMPEIENT